MQATIQLDDGNEILVQHISATECMISIKRFSVPLYLGNETRLGLVRMLGRSNSGTIRIRAGEMAFVPAKDMLVVAVKKHVTNEIALTALDLSYGARWALIDALHNMAVLQSRKEAFDCASERLSQELIDVNRRYAQLREEYADVLDFNTQEQD